MSLAALDSITSSLGSVSDNPLFDYVIIDEASWDIKNLLKTLMILAYEARLSEVFSQWKARILRVSLGFGRSMYQDIAAHRNLGMFVEHFCADSRQSYSASLHSLYNQDCSFQKSFYQLQNRF